MELSFLTDSTFWARWLQITRIDLVPAGGGVLGYVAGDIILKDPWIIAQMGHLLAATHLFAPLVLGVAIVILGRWTDRRDPQEAN